jgi:hypothetical protein
MAIADDFSVAVNGDIRYTGSGATTYTVLAFKNYLGALIDDAQASGDDLADITTETPYERSTDQILTLNSPFNIDDTAAEHLFDGSITQNGGDDVYSGLYVVGVVESGTEPMIVQDNKMLTPYWGTGLNPDAAENVIMKIIVKTRSNGADINNKKIRVLAREYGDTYAEFDVTLGLANATAAIFTSDDLNAETVEATVEGWTSIVNTEGFQLLDIDGNGTGEEYYSKWDIGSRSINDTYERTKWIAKRALDADTNAETGNDLTVDDATTYEGIGAEFSARDNDQKLVEARLRLKIAGTPTGNMYCELFLSDDAATPEPTGSVLATSESLDVNRLTTTYQEVIFRFTDNYTMTANEAYFIVIRHPTGTAANYIIAEGDTSTGDDGSYAYWYPSVWTGVGTTQLWFKVRSCPIIHSIAGELFRGITEEIVYDGESGGPFQEDEEVVWGTRIVYDGLNGGFTRGMFVSFWNGSTQVNDGKILYDNGSTEMLVALRDSSGGTLADNYIIKDVDDPSTNYADIATTIENQDKAGGESILLALDDNGVDGDLYVQRTYGSAPVDDLPLRGITSTCTAAVNATVNARTIKAEFVGQSTGSNIIGAYGIGFDPNDVGANDTFFDLSNTQRTPPNNVTFTVSGLVSGEDRILIGPRSGSTLNKGQYTLETTLNGAGETVVKVNPDIQTETPSSGVGADNPRIRVQLDSGIYRRQDYSSWGTVADEFIIPSTDYSGANVATAGKNVFVAYIDVLANAGTEAFTAVHATDRDILIRVRDGGTAGDGEPIKTYESSATFTASPQTVSINRVSDA